MAKKLLTKLNFVHKPYRRCYIRRYSKKKNSTVRQINNKVFLTYKRIRVLIKHLVLLLL